MGIELLPKVGDGTLLSSCAHKFSENFVNFEFAYPVYQWVVGIWGFSLCHPDGHAASVETVSLTLSSRAQGNVVTVDIDATLTDGHGHELDRENSWVIPVCLAVTRDPATGTLLQALEGEIGDGRAMPVLMPGEGPYATAQSVLAGFSLSYGKNQSVLGMSAGCDFTYAEGTGTVGASASMYDTHANRAQDAGVYAGCIAMGSSQGLTVTPIEPTQRWGHVAVPVSGTFSQAAVMLTNFEVQYQGDDDHWVTYVSAEAVGWTFTVNEVPVTFESGSVWLPALAMVMGDRNSSHFQDDKQSNVSALLLTL